MSDIPEGWTLLPRPTPFSPDILVPTDFLKMLEESRYRNCLTIGCGKSFKFTHEDDWTCPDCKAQRAEVKRRQGVEGDLLDAMGRVKL
jgi:hypothetical protein